LKNPVRLENVDAPERGRAGGAAATDQLRRVIEREKVRIVTQARDAYGRSVAKVYVGNRSVNSQMRRRLMEAWAWSPATTKSPGSGGRITSARSVWSATASRVLRRGTDHGEVRF